MSLQIRRFRIVGLYGNRTIDAEFKENRLILVGENGTGKSTFVNFLYFFLTGAWENMLSVEFESVTLELYDQEPISIHRKDLHASEASIESLLKKYIPTSLDVSTDDITRFILRKIKDLTNNSQIRMKFRREFGLPPYVADKVLGELESINIIRDNYNLNEIRRRLRKLLINHQILFLPTYRRIEKELSHIRPELENPSRVGRRIPRIIRPSSLSFEFAEFGMEDVIQTVAQKMSELSTNLNSDLRTLLGRYVKDVIRKSYKNIPARDLDTETINNALNRVGKDFLSLAELDDLRKLIKKMENNVSLENDDKVVVHFVYQLVELHEKLRKQEEEVEKFVSVCNKYLIEKNMVYDSLNFTLLLETTRGSNRKSDLTENIIELSDLSSGEKQIISLFSHIYLSGGDKYFVIIDEPELSLSVPWQRQFLPDIIDSGKCSGLIAVTHSPFIFDNELDEFTYSLEQFTDGNE